MPSYFGDILTVTQEELIPVYWKDYNHLAHELWRYKNRPYGLKRVQRGGNGRRLRIDFDSLPPHVQEGLGDPRKHKHILLPYYDTDASAVRYYTQEFRYPDGAYLPRATQEQYITNASVLNAVIRLREARVATIISKGHKPKGIMGTLCADVASFNETLNAHHGVTHNIPSHPRHFNNLVKRFEEVGYYGVIRDPEGKRRKNALRRDAKTSELLNNLFAGQGYKPNATQVAAMYAAFINKEIDVVNEKTGELYNPNKYKSLSEGAIRQYLSEYESKIGTYAKRSGDRQVLMQSFIPYASLEQPMFAGSMISIDDRQPPFWYEKGKRMWWYVGVDLASECVTAWAYGKTKEELILNFYRQMVRNYHEWGVSLPDALECESSLNSSFKDTFLKQGAMFQNVMIYPNSARSKTIERIFRRMRYGNEKSQEGWIGRPFAKAEANQAGPDKTKIIPYDTLVKQSFKNIITWNNSANTQDKKMSRFDYFKNNQHPELKETSYKSFLHHIGYKTASSCRAGIMKLQHKEWLLGDDNEIYTGEKLVNLLKKVEGKDIDIYWLDDNKGAVLKALVYTKKGRCICEALPKPISAKAPIEARAHHKEAQTVFGRYRATVSAYMRHQKNRIDKVSVIDFRPKTVSDTFSIEGVESSYKRPTQIADILPVHIEEERPRTTSPSWNDAFKI